MNASASLIVPVFAVVAVGYAAARTRAISHDALSGLSAFVFNFAIPAMLFRSLSLRGMPETSAWRLLLAYYVPALAVFGLGIGLARAVRTDLRSSVLVGMGGSYGNCALLGMPLVLGAYGEEGATPFFLLLAVHGPLLMTLVAVCFESLDGGQQGIASTLAQTARGLLSNPIVVSIAAGSLWSWSGVGLQAQVDEALSILGRAAIPCALFTLGGTLAKHGLSGNAGLAGLSTGLKMLVLPAFVWVMGRFLGLSPVDLGVATLTAAMPTGVNVFLFADRYRADLGLASSNVVVATAFAMPSLTLCLWLLE